MEIKLNLTDEEIRALHGAAEDAKEQYPEWAAARTLFEKVLSALPKDWR